MVVIAIAYIALSFLMVLGAVVFFVKAIQSLTRPASNPSRPVAPSETVGYAHEREEIVARLERQFHSSPSSDL